MEGMSLPKTRPWWKRPSALWAFAVGAWALSFMVGWFLPPPTSHGPQQPIRLLGYRFTRPLLACDANIPKSFPELQALSDKIDGVIAAHKKTGDIEKASTYFKDLTAGSWSDTNQTETYYPSSLGKLPIMIAYFELAETSSSILEQKVAYDGAEDLNKSQDIPPAEHIVPGRTYTIEQLIEYMIRYSDNNAAELLYEGLDKNALRNIYNDLQIPLRDDVTIADLDFVTPSQISTILRVLYNATYLSHDYSEKALEILSRSSFAQGLVAGLPGGIPVAHKMGLVDVAPDGIVTEHELHDCGIVYAPNHSYLLCVMTRSSAPLPQIEGTIADISKTVYQAVESGVR